MLTAILIAGWAFLKDQRAKNLNPAPVSIIQNPGTATTADVDAEIEDIDAQLQLLDEDYANINETVTQPAAESGEATNEISK